MQKLKPHHLLTPEHDALDEILREHYDLCLVSFTLPKKGIKNTTVLAQTNKGRFVLRVYPKQGKNDNDIQHEVRLLIHMSENGVPAPRIIPDKNGKLIVKHARDGVVWSCVLMEHMPGANPKIYRRMVIPRLAKNHARMHELGITYAKDNPYRGRVVRVLEDKRFLPQIDQEKIKRPEVRAFLGRAEQYSLPLDSRLPYGINHLDYVRGNILIRRGKLSAVLDFGDVAYAPIVVCVAITLYSQLHVSKDTKRMHEYLRAYERFRKLSVVERSVLTDILIYRNYEVGAQEVFFNGEHNRLMEYFLAWERGISRLDFSA